MSKCLVCARSTEAFINFGPMPIANGFTLPQDLPANPKDEFVFEMKVGFCPECKMVQLLELVDEKKMFHGNYPFFSSTSVKMKEHFRALAEFIQKDYLAGKPDPFVVEIGSNDGILLQNFAEKGIRHLGIEPSTNVAEVARKKGIRTISKFFNEEVAREIVAENGQADAFMAANVMCHIPYVHSVFSGIRTLLKPTGILSFEDPYLGDIVQKTSYDQIYDEHCFYFSLQSVDVIARRNGLELFDAIPQGTHGGSMRYILGHPGQHPQSARLKDLWGKELELKLDREETYRTFAKNVERSRDDLVALLRKLKKEGAQVAAYAATSKSTTVTNYCGIGPDLVECIYDTTPLKHGRLNPGTHIPVRPYEEFKTQNPPYTLLFGWNHMQEIFEKEKDYFKRGGQFIVYVPRIEVMTQVKS